MNQYVDSTSKAKLSMLSTSIGTTYGEDSNEYLPDTDQSSAGGTIAGESDRTLPRSTDCTTFGPSESAVFKAGIPKGGRGRGQPRKPFDAKLEPRRARVRECMARTRERDRQARQRLRAEDKVSSRRVTGTRSPVVNATAQMQDDTERDVKRHNDARAAEFWEGLLDRIRQTVTEGSISEGVHTVTLTMPLSALWDHPGTLDLDTIEVCPAGTSLGSTSSAIPDTRVTSTPEQAGASASPSDDLDATMDAGWAEHIENAGKSTGAYVPIGEDLYDLGTEGW